MQLPKQFLFGVAVLTGLLIAALRFVGGPPDVASASCDPASTDYHEAEKVLDASARKAEAVQTYRVATILRSSLTEGPRAPYLPAR